MESTLYANQGNQHEVHLFHELQGPGNGFSYCTLIQR